MCFPRRFFTPVVCCLVLISPALGQLDSSALRAKLGSPLNRETFHMAAGFDVVVDYIPTGTLVCRIQVPALMPSKETVTNTADMKRGMYDFLADLVPSSMRGRELGRMLMSMGVSSESTINYENVIIRELRDANHPLGDTISVSFKDFHCDAAASH